MAYAIALAHSVADPATLRQYSERVPRTLEKYHGKALAFDGNAEVKEGGWKLVRAIILEFPSMQDALGWYHSAEYQEILPLRLQSARSTVIFLHSLGEAVETAA